MLSKSLAYSKDGIISISRPPQALAKLVSLDVSKWQKRMQHAVRTDAASSYLRFILSLFLPTKTKPEFTMTDYLGRVWSLITTWIQRLCICITFVPRSDSGDIEQGFIDRDREHDVEDDRRLSTAPQPPRKTVSNVRSIGRRPNRQQEGQSKSMDPLNFGISVSGPSIWCRWRYREFQSYRVYGCRSRSIESCATWTEDSCSRSRLAQPNSPKTLPWRREFLGRYSESTVVTRLDRQRSPNQNYTATARSCQSLFPRQR